jgi:hypothetical protein
MIQQDQLNIKKVNNKYRIILRESFLLFFDRWIDVTWRGEDQIDKPIEFDTFKEAKEFIFMVTL